MSDKPSWRDIDQRRDRGLKPQKSASKLEERAQKLASKAAKKDLEALFSGSKRSQEMKQSLEDIRSLRGTSSYYDRMSQYRETFGSRGDWDFQMMCLDHRDVSIVIEVLDELKKSAPLEPLARQQTLGQKLKVMALGTFDAKLLEKIQEVQSAILAKF